MIGGLNDIVQNELKYLGGKLLVRFKKDISNDLMSSYPDEELVYMCKTFEPGIRKFICGNIGKSMKKLKMILPRFVFGFLDKKLRLKLKT